MTQFVRDRDDVITSWNRAAIALYGWERDEAVGRKTHDLLHTEFPKPLPEIMADLMRTGHWEGELVHTRGTVREGPWRAVGPSSAIPGRPAAILETNNDITERRSAEDKLDKAQAELAHVSRVATLGELTASIGHEIRGSRWAAVVTHGGAVLRWLGLEVPDLAEARSSI
jgi:PAS domain S-box-containing protein